MNIINWCYTIGLLAVVGHLAFATFSYSETYGSRWLGPGGYAIGYTAWSAAIAGIWMVSAAAPVPHYGSGGRLTKMEKNPVLYASKGPIYRGAVWSYYAMYLILMGLNLLVLWFYVAVHGFFGTPVTTSTGHAMDRWYTANQLVSINNFIAVLISINAVYAFAVSMGAKFVKQSKTEEQPLLAF
jgi:hypothetical protein